MASPALEGVVAAKVWALLESHGPASVFAWGVGKSLLPFPAPSVFVLAGAVAVHPGASLASALGTVFLRVGLPGAAGITLGAYPYYRWAYRGGWPALERWGPRLGLSRRMLRRWGQALGRRRVAAILLLRALPVAPVVLGSAVAGVAQAGLWEYALWTFLGSLIRTVLLGVLGWAMRESYGNLGWRFAPWEARVLLALSAAAILLLLLRRRRAAA